MQGFCGQRQTGLSHQFEWVRPHHVLQADATHPETRHHEGNRAVNEVVGERRECIEQDVRKLTLKEAEARSKTATGILKAVGKTLAAWPARVEPGA